MTHDEKERALIGLLPRIRLEALSTARRFGGPADDLIQEASLAAWVAIGKFDESLGFKLWSYVRVCIHRQLLNSWHRQKREAKERASGFLEDQVDHRQNTGIDQVQFDELVRTCRPRDAEILRKQFVCGHTQQEIGDRCGCSKQAINQCTRRGLAAVRKAVAA